MAKKLGRDGRCRYTADDPNGIGVGCHIVGVITGNGNCSDKKVTKIEHHKRYVVIIDGGAIRSASGSELDTYNCY